MTRSQVAPAHWLAMEGMLNPDDKQPKAARRGLLGGAQQGWLSLRVRGHRWPLNFGSRRSFVFMVLSCELGVTGPGHHALL